MQQAIVMYECKNRKSDEFREFGARMVENGALNQKIWAPEAFRDKMVFSGGYGVILEFLEWLEGLGTKDRGSTEVCGFFRDFGGFLECFERFRTYS
jgi:hypothetical protein